MRDGFTCMVRLVASWHEPKRRAMYPVVDFKLQKCYLGMTSVQ